MADGHVFTSAEGNGAESKQRMRAEGPRQLLPLPVCTVVLSDVLFFFNRLSCFFFFFFQAIDCGDESVAMISMSLPSVAVLVKLFHYVLESRVGCLLVLVIHCVYYNCSVKAQKYFITTGYIRQVPQPCFFLFSSVFLILFFLFYFILFFFFFFFFLGGGGVGHRSSQSLLSVAKDFFSWALSVNWESLLPVAKRMSHGHCHLIGSHCQSQKECLMGIVT